MSRNPKPSAAETGGNTDVGSQSSVSLEQAMERLDSILEEMETGELPLEELIGRFEQGVALVKFCRERLESAEQRIEMVTKQLDGSLGLAEFPAENS